MDNEIRERLRNAITTLYLHSWGGGIAEDISRLLNENAKLKEENEKLKALLKNAYFDKAEIGKAFDEASNGENEALLEIDALTARAEKAEAKLRMVEKEIEQGGASEVAAFVRKNFIDRDGCGHYEYRGLEGQK
jgi:regulator of replication initiation timing